MVILWKMENPGRMSRLPPFQRELRWWKGRKRPKCRGKWCLWRRHGGWEISFHGRALEGHRRQTCPCNPTPTLIPLIPETQNAIYVLWTMLLPFFFLLLMLYYALAIKASYVVAVNLGNTFTSMYVCIYSSVTFRARQGVVRVMDSDTNYSAWVSFSDNSIKAAEYFLYL